jgi:hypothetical protein
MSTRPSCHRPPCLLLVLSLCLTVVAFGEEATGQTPKRHTEMTANLVVDANAKPDEVTTVEDRVARLVGAIANTNKPPQVVSRPKGRPEEVPLFPENYNWREDDRVVKALDRLYQDKTSALWEELVRRQDDPRYCITIIGESENVHVLSVGGACHKLAYARLIGAFKQHLPHEPTEGGRVIPIDLGEGLDNLAEWRKKRKDKPFYQLQIEVCEIAIREVSRMNRIPEVVKKSTCLKIESEIRKLKKLEEPVFTGPSSFPGTEAFFTPELAKMVRYAIKHGSTGHILLRP